jgi:hypothetical protein
LLLGGVTILKQLTGLEYTLCPSLLFNTVCVQGARRGGPARTTCYARLPEEVMIFEPSLCAGDMTIFGFLRFQKMCVTVRKLVISLKMCVTVRNAKKMCVSANY